MFYEVNKERAGQTPAEFATATQLWSNPLNFRMGKH